jgi:hypothetical protein
MGPYMRLKLKKGYKSKFCMVTPPKTVSDLFISHTQVQVCKKLDNSIDEKNQLIFKSLPRTVKCKFSMIK